MARYKATRRGYAGRLVEEGEEFDFDGPAGSWMEEVASPPTEGAQPLEDLTKEEIADRLNELDVNFDLKMKKSDLLALLRDAVGE